MRTDLSPIAVKAEHYERIKALHAFWQKVDPSNVIEGLGDYYDEWEWGDRMEPHWCGTQACLAGWGAFLFADCDTDLFEISVGATDWTADGGRWDLLFSGAGSSRYDAHAPKGSNDWQIANHRLECWLAEHYPGA